MGALCVIIGFQYEGKFRIPGILIDMFRVYTFAKRADMKVMVVTDVKKDTEDKELSKGITLKNCDSRIFSFIRSLQKNGEYRYWSSIPETINEISSYLSVEEERIFFYYTGHAKDKDLLFPNHLLCPVEEITKEIYGQGERNKQILFLFDCCNASYVDLPFLLSMDFSVSRYRTTAVTKGGMYHMHTSNSTFCPHEVICICSAMVNEDAIATWTGSTFTQLFFHTLEKYDRVRNIHIILKKVQEVLKGKQSCRAYASHPTLVSLFPWLFHPEIQRIDYTKNGLSVVLVKQKS